MFMDRRFNILKVPVLSGVLYKFNAIPVKMSTGYLWNLINSS